MGYARSVTAWLAVVTGVLLGMLVIAYDCGSWIGTSSRVNMTAAIIAGSALIVASLVAPRHPRVASRMELWSIPFLLPIIFHFPDWQGLLALAIFLMLGFFWRLVARRNWPPLLAASSHRFLPVIFGTALACFLVFVALVCSVAFPWWDPVGDCGGRPVLDENGAPRCIDFTCKIIFVGPRTFHGRWSLWALARVEEPFQAWPRPSQIVVVRQFFDRSDESREYFVEGGRGDPALSWLIPVIRRADCGRTGSRESAEVALRILHDGKPKDGVRLIGRVYKGDRWYRGAGSVVSGVSILVEGPAGRTDLKTDAQGVYDAKGLPPGEYKLRMVGNEPQEGVCDLKSGDIDSRSFLIR